MMASAVTSSATSSNQLFNGSLISAAPKATLRCLDSPSIRSPIVNKFLSLGRPDLNVSAGSTSSLSSSISSESPLKLRDLPHTTTLNGCVAFVDVWSSDGTDNRSCVFRNFLTRMGATVCKKFTKEFDITHVVFKDGHKSVLQKAQKRNIKIVTCLWVDRCRVLQKWVNEEDYLFDPTSYKPPKRFYEMQPRDPEESVHRSAERLKRRKARFAKKNAHIMFQSPLVTNHYTGTPKDSTPGNEQEKSRILVADTPYHPPSPFLYLSPSIVHETPLTDSMKRKLQRLKEGKRVFSPPSSDGEEEEDPHQVSPQRPTESLSLSNVPKETTQTEKERFSPIPETQCFVKKSWRKSGISPPKFDVSCDEIPETQQMDTGSEIDNHLMNNNGLAERLKPSNDAMSDKTVHLNEDMEMTALANGSEPISLHRGITDIIEERSHCPVVSSQPATQETPQNLNLHLSHDSSLSLGEDNDDKVFASSVEESKQQNDCSPTDRNISTKRGKSSRRRKRKLLTDSESLEPVSVLVSPKSSTSEADSEKMDKTARNSLQLPELGFSAYKTLTQSGRFFHRLSSRAPSECSLLSSEPRSQSTDYDCADACSEDKRHAEDIPIVNEHLGLYDRIKLRNQRHSRDMPDESISSQKLNSSTRKRKKSDDSGKTSSPENNRSCEKSSKRAKTDATQLGKNLFCSQAAISILQSLKKRRSSVEFRTPMIANGENYAKSQKGKKHKRKPVIVLTNLHSDERFDVHKAVRTLSGFRISSTVRDQTTHVVCGAARRTLNVLRAIARGIWLLSKNWVMDSLSAGFWLEEESYEIPSLFPAAQKNRRSRERSSTWKNNVFAGVKGHIYVSDDTKPPQEELKKLITLCGGSIVGSPRRASLCVGNPGRVIPLMQVVSETWVLDSITENSLQQSSAYLIEPA